MKRPLNERKPRAAQAGLFLACLFAGGIFLAGCTTTGGQREERTHLFITRTGRRVTLSWDSTAGRAYTLLVARKLNAKLQQWEPVPGCVLMKGTGKKMIVRQTAPLGETQYYRLQSVPLN